jgi:hypothetical protein
MHALYTEFERPDYNEMLSKIWSLMSEFELARKMVKSMLMELIRLSSSR